MANNINDKAAAVGAFNSYSTHKRLADRAWARAMSAKKNGNEKEARMLFGKAKKRYNRANRALEVSLEFAKEAEAKDRMINKFLREEDKANK